MNSRDFAEVLQSTSVRIANTLNAKGSEYATNDDRLKNFRKAAGLQGETLSQALAGMMAKHTISIYDMIELDANVPIEVWDEKIIDHINYLILLRAIRIEQQKQDPGF